MTKRPFPTDPTLTAIAIAYRNPAHHLIGRKALPPIPVLSETFKWHRFPIAEAFTVPELRVGRTSRPGQIEFTAEEETGQTYDYGLDDPIPYSDIRAAERARAEGTSSYDPRIAAVEGLTNLIELGREIRAANVVQDAANYAADKKITLVGTDKFSDYANSDPYGVIDDGLDKTLIFRPNTISMGQSVWSKLKRHPKLIKAVKGGLTDEGAITKAQFAELFELEVDNVLIGMAQVNTARKGQDPTLNRVWGNSIQLTYIDPSKQAANDKVMTWGFTAEHGDRISGSIDDEDIGLEGGERVRTGEKTAELVVAKDIGYQIIDAI